MKNMTMWEAIVVASHIGFGFAASVVLGVLAGLYLDSITNRSPLFIILGALAGTAAGVYSSLQIVRYLQRNGRSD